jgi:anaerobic selenocysteine-containing dehydrogenase
MPPVEEPDVRYPFWLTTGRVVYHWHTRTKTGRVPELRAAAPEPFVEIGRDDAKRLDIQEGDLVRMGSRRGVVEIRACLADIATGHLFMPFHFGDWDDAGSRAGNELTITDWDPVNKQPHLKFAAVWVMKS